MNRSLAVACFFLSGFAGLVYEIAWIKQASLVFGSTTWALSTVLGVFFGGLALGSWLIGRLAGRLERPLRLYALLEIAVAGLALLSPLAFRFIDGIYDGFYAQALRTATDPAGMTWYGAGPGAAFARVGLVAVILLPPTVLMGGTLPLFCRQFVVSADRIAGSVGMLYGVNTLGAALGTLAAGFLLIPGMGVGGSIMLAAGLNLIAGLTALVLPLRAPAGTNIGANTGANIRANTATHAALAAPAGPTAKPLARGRFQAALPVVSALFLVTGLVAIAAEILWSRFLALLIRNSVTTYTVTLTVVLLGIVLGSFLAARLGDRRRTLGLGPAHLFAACQIVAALVMVLLMFLPVGFWRGTAHASGSGPWPYFLLMLPPAILSGACFPLANRLVLEDPRLAAARVGRLTALNTLGGIAGSLLAGFFILPQLGLAAGVRIITLIGLMAGLTALWALTPAAGKSPLVRLGAVRLGISAAALAAWFLIPALGATRLPADYLAAGGRLVDFAEGHGSSLAAVRTEGQLTLEIDNLWQGSDGKGHQIMAAHVPALLHPNPRQVLVIGAGVGQTAGRFLLHGIERLDCVDIEPEIFPFIARNFPAAWITDPRVRLVPDDGRTFVAHARERYDIISVEVGQVFRPGVDAFYTREFYRDARDRLQPGGLIAQFVSLGFFQREEFAGVLATFLEVFPQAVLWYNTQELLLVGGADVRPALDLGRLEAVDPAGPLGRDLAWSHWGGPRHHLIRPGAFLGGFLTDAQGLAALASGAPVYTDDRPTLAYATAEAQSSDRLEEALVPVVRAHLATLDRALTPGSSPDADLLALAAETRELNLRDIAAAGLLAQAAAQQNRLGPAATMDLLHKALERNPQSFLAQANLGKALLLAGQLERAEPFLREALQLRPDRGVTRRDLGLILLRTDRSAEAREHLRQAARDIPDDPAVHNYLGTALAVTGDLPAAVAEFQRALTLDPKDDSIRQNLARARAGLARK